MDGQQQQQQQQHELGGGGGSGVSRGFGLWGRRQKSVVSLNIIVQIVLLKSHLFFFAAN